MTYIDSAPLPSDSYRVARDAALSLRETLRTRTAQISACHSPGSVVAAQRAGQHVVCWVADRDQSDCTEGECGERERLAQGRRYDEAAALVRALLIARDEQRRRAARQRLSLVYDYTPRIIAEIRARDPNLVRGRVRRFVEIGVPGFCLDDTTAEGVTPLRDYVVQLTAARSQLAAMSVPGLIVARTSAEAVWSIDGQAGEVDAAFVLGATRLDVPPFRTASLAVSRRFGRGVAPELSGYTTDAAFEAEWSEAERWLRACGVSQLADRALASVRSGRTSLDRAFHSTFGKFAASWRRAAEARTWCEVTATKSLAPVWDREHAQTYFGRDQIRGGVDYAVARALASAPHADVVMFEANELDLGSAERFARAVRARSPDTLLAYAAGFPSTPACDVDLWRAAQARLAASGYVLFLTL